jgi:hypothetical protein
LLPLLGPTDGWCRRAAITVDLSHSDAKIGPVVDGTFFEEINHAGDGGLYAQAIPRLKTSMAGAAVRP